MARRIINRDTYEALLEAFREEPGNTKAAAEAAGCSWHMAKRALELGWPERFPWARPIREHLHDDLTRGRAERLLVVSEAAEKERVALDSAASLDAAQAMALEGAGVLSALRAGSSLLASFAEIAEAARPIVAKVVQQLKEIGEDEDAEVNAVDALKLLGALAHNVRQVNAAHREAQQMERLILGEPGQIVGTVDLTEKGAQDALDRAKRAVARAESAELHVINGGE